MADLLRSSEMRKVLVIAVALLFALSLRAAQAEEPACPQDTHAIYTADGVLVSCEELVGSPESCPDDALPGYLEDGTLAGCFTGSIATEEV
jgi:hypothetical protein